MVKKIYQKGTLSCLLLLERRTEKLAEENPSNADLTTMALRPGHSTSGAAKMRFSGREINEAAVFENQSKERLFFSKSKHAFCRKLKNKKIIPKRVVKDAHFSSSFFTFSS